MRLTAGREALPFELINGIRAAGGFSQFIASNTPLPENAQKSIEQAITRVGRQRLVIVDRLISAGLVTSVPDWWGVPSIQRAKVGESGHAKRSFLPNTRGERQVADRGSDSWPVFVTSDDFSFNIREERTANRANYQIDTVHAEQATRNVNFAIEDQAINGLTDEFGTAFTINGLSAPGLLSSTNTFSYATWTGLTGPQIQAVVTAAIEDDMRQNKFYGPFTLFVPGNYGKMLSADYVANYPKSTLARLLEIGPYGGRNLEVVPADLLPDNRVLLVQMTSDVVDVVVGQTPTPVTWQDGPKWNNYWVVLACVFTRMFPNYNGDYGVLAGNLA